ncbi:hypothetical protein MJ904_19575 [Massilia sp. MB5]|uniref:hypothetical protein n=1 Tax=Massilia sp. MB5 TaxID=2919578 RepID=UPI001F0FA14A|nr:hypothetical protein [Massilia sp. MB5]UMR29267.1 hypothetical protein MJ904_19575 [Massilia sp. MB5]
MILINQGFLNNPKLHRMEIPFWEANMATFYGYFKENMEALGLPAPEGVFANLQTATANASTLLAYIDKYGKKVTIGELLGAGMRLEKLATVGALSAAYYAGAVVGSIAVAGGRSLAGGVSLGEVLYRIQSRGLWRAWLVRLLHKSPEVYKTNFNARHAYRHRALRTGK